MQHYQLYCLVTYKKLQNFLQVCNISSWLQTL